jgi:hypothetical protein
MQRQSVLNLLFNVVGLALGLVLVVYLINAAFETVEVPPCSATYPAPMQFALTSEGRLLTKIDLQGRAGHNEWGIGENASVVSDGPAGAAIQVRLDSVPTRESGDGVRANGAEFRWHPAGLANATSACLRYSVWVPEKFEFATGGILPGLYGGMPDGLAELPVAESRFGTHVKWRQDGQGEFDAQTPGGDFRAVSQKWFPFERGRWMRFEQELSLNGVGQENGHARLWVDGALVSENDKLTLRQHDTAKFSGVLVDVGYLRDPPPPGENVVRISPFELSWR